MLLATHLHEHWIIWLKLWVLRCNWICVSLRAHLKSIHSNNNTNKDVKQWNKLEFNNEWSIDYTELEYVKVADFFDDFIARKGAWIHRKYFLKSAHLQQYLDLHSHTQFQILDSRPIIFCFFVIAFLTDSWFHIKPFAWNNKN